ncbi:hypothetical protein G6O67_003839 [Ophiocordyceps sinensis]|uniref:Uncharacterized protein n=1 Tax=Ophiocordyceps sinensis TaxID=72228 RepID=A0A8H4PSI7_9HYPO|nr:hypothetical protein G6O67_003839 [Ophiocordyceps sinensis]
MSTLTPAVSARRPATVLPAVPPPTTTKSNRAPSGTMVSLQLTSQESVCGSRVRWRWWVKTSWSLSVLVQEQTILLYILYVVDSGSLPCRVRPPSSRGYDLIRPA